MTTREWWQVAADEFDPVLRLRDDYPTPGALAQRLDPMTVQTPALEIIDAHLVQVRDAIAVMYERRSRFADLVRQDVDEEEAIEQTVSEIPPAGIDRLLISFAPQQGKSARVTRYGILWLLRQFPTLRIGLVSYDGANAAQFSYQIRADIELFNGVSDSIDLGLRLAKDQKAMGRWLLTTGGGVYAIGVGGGLTGRPLDLLILDDPLKDVQAADSVLRSAQQWEWWQTVARPRLAPWAPVEAVMTRWHEADLFGRMISKQKEDEAAGLAHYDKWTVVNIPAQADHDPGKGEVDILGRAPGEFMVSARGQTTEQWEATKAATAPRFWTALYQGRPAPETGAIWLKEWWRRYDVPLWSQRSDGTFRFDGYEVTQSWDCAFRDTKTSDYVVGQVWAKRGADSYLVYELWRRMSFTQTLDAVRHVTWMFPQSRRKIIEGKANGDAVIDSLKHEIPGIVVFEPGRDSKESRATAVSPYIRAGNVHLPTTRVASMAPEISFDVEAFIVEATAFPNAAHNDQIDAASQYLIEAYLVGGKATLLLPTGVIPLSAARRQRQQALPVQQRLTAGGQHSHWGQALSPFQQRLTDRQRRR